MSEPWIKVYVSDLRGDPKVAALNCDERWALLHAWEIAKNSPGQPGELRRPDGATLTESELRRLADVIPERTRTMFRRWQALGLCTIDDEGCVCFPTLARRQGIDRTNAERQARHRAKNRPDGPSPGNGTVTDEVTDEVTPPFEGTEGGSNGPSNGHVTAQMPDARYQTPEQEPLVRPAGELVEQARPIDRVWRAYQEHHPRSVLTPARRKRIRDRLRHYDADTLVAAIDGNHRDPWCCGDNAEQREYHDLELILRDAAHIERYAAVPVEPMRRVVGSGARPVENWGADIIEMGRRRRQA